MKVFPGVIVLAIGGCWTANRTSPPATSSQPVAGPTEDPAPTLRTARAITLDGMPASSGGIIELGDTKSPDRMNATMQMEKHCGKNRYTVTQEGEEAVATTLGGIIITAWRIHYQSHFATP